MRKFIISDIHGDDKAYYPIMKYLEAEREKGEVSLFIDGDLFDRGKASADILLDVYNRRNDSNLPIEYLGGNHELMMMEVFREREKGMYSGAHKRWFRNGGAVTDNGLGKKLQTKEEILDVVDYISNLKIYHKFDEKLNGRHIVLVHAACPFVVKDECDKRLKQNTDDIYFNVWAREEDPEVPFRMQIGNPEFFTIVGHTPNEGEHGYQYDSRQNVLNVDGGCSYYVCGNKEVDHVPLVEVKDHYLRIITFNHEGDIIAGNFFDGQRSEPFSEEELKREKVKVKER